MNFVCGKWDSVSVGKEERREVCIVLFVKIGGKIRFIKSCFMLNVNKIKRFEICMM